ncbi:protein kinase [Plasmodium gonderi]|uniref:Protein kinase n=1 Tax=Plasmodium gonderi TaxID=77519 RepID=A0A1Y1JDI4_PLAGO|nr:protein kinase [Plasmodium gonderi]GAW79385.1 protein kinase [Plasmodium gonderi]
MGQRNAKIQKEGIYDINNDICNNRYNNLTYNNTSEINPRNYNFNNIKIMEDEENYSSNMNSANNATHLSNVNNSKTSNHLFGVHHGKAPHNSQQNSRLNGHQNNHLNGQHNNHLNDQHNSHLNVQYNSNPQDYRNPIKAKNDHMNSHYAQINRENGELDAEFIKNNVSNPYHLMNNNDMGYMTQNRIVNRDTHSPNMHNANTHNNQVNLPPNIYKYNNKNLDDKYGEMKNNWGNTNYLYGAMTPSANVTNKNNMNPFDNDGKMNSPSYGNHFNMNTLHNNFNNNIGMHNDMGIRHMENNVHASNDDYGNNYAGFAKYDENYNVNLGDNQYNTSSYSKNKVPEIDDIIKKYTAKENQEEHFKFNWDHGKADVTGGIHKDSNKHVRGSDFRNYISNEDRNGNPTNQENQSISVNPANTTSHMNLPNPNSHMNLPNPNSHMNQPNPSIHMNQPNPSSHGNQSKYTHKANLLYPNILSLRNKENDEEEKKREKKINLLKNIIVTSPKQKYNFSFNDDLYESLPPHEQFYFNTSSIADLNQISNVNNDLLGEGVQNRANVNNNIYDDFNTFERMNETPAIMNQHQSKNEVPLSDEDWYMEKFGEGNIVRDFHHSDKNTHFQNNSPECILDNYKFSHNFLSKGEQGKNTNYTLRDRHMHNMNLYDHNMKQKSPNPISDFTNNTRHNNVQDFHTNRINKFPFCNGMLKNRFSVYTGDKEGELCDVRIREQIDNFDTCTKRDGRGKSGIFGQLNCFKNFDNNSSPMDENRFKEHIEQTDVTLEGRDNDMYKKYSSTNYHTSNMKYGAGGTQERRSLAMQANGRDMLANPNSINIFKNHARNFDNYEEENLFNKSPMNEIQKQMNKYNQEDTGKPNSKVLNFDNIFNTDIRNEFPKQNEKFSNVKNYAFSNVQNEKDNVYKFDEKKNSHFGNYLYENKNFIHKNGKDMIRRYNFDKSGRALFEPYNDTTLKHRQHDHLSTTLVNNWDVKNSRNYRDSLRGPNINGDLDIHDIDREEGVELRNNLGAHGDDENIGAICLNVNNKKNMEKYMEKNMEKYMEKNMEKNMKKNSDFLLPKPNPNFLNENRSATMFDGNNITNIKIHHREETTTKDNVKYNSNYGGEKILNKMPNSIFNNYHSFIKTNPLNEHLQTFPTSNNERGGVHNFMSEKKNEKCDNKDKTISDIYKHLNRDNIYIDIENQPHDNKTNAYMTKPNNIPYSMWKHEPNQNVNNSNPFKNCNKADMHAQYTNLVTPFNDGRSKNVHQQNRDFNNEFDNNFANNFATDLPIRNNIWEEKNNKLGTTGAKAFLGILSEEQNRYSNLLNTMGKYTARDVSDPLASYRNKKSFNLNSAHNFSFVKQPIHKQLPPLPFKNSMKQTNQEGMNQAKLKIFENDGRLGIPGKVEKDIEKISAAKRIGNFHTYNNSSNNHMSNLNGTNYNFLKGNFSTFREKDGENNVLTEFTLHGKYTEKHDAMKKRNDFFNYKDESKECMLKNINTNFNHYSEHSNFLNEKNAVPNYLYTNIKNKYSEENALDNVMGKGYYTPPNRNSFFNKVREGIPKDDSQTRENQNLTFLQMEDEWRSRNFTNDKAERRISMSNNISMLLEKISDNSDKKTGEGHPIGNHPINNHPIGNHPVSSNHLSNHRNTVNHQGSEISNLHVNTVNYNDNLNIDTNHFVISDNHLCNFGLWSLYRCKLKHENYSFLINIIDSFYLNSGNGNDTVANNILFHKRLRHINIMSYKGKTADKNKLYLLFEHIHGNILKSHSTPLEENIIASYAYQIVDLLEYMHANFIIFHGLLSNIIILQKNTKEELLQILHEKNKNVNKYFDIYKHGIIKVFNFDFSNMDATEKDYEFDFLCLAVLIYEMCTKYNTYYSSKYEDLVERIHNTSFFFPHFVSFELKNFCYELCSKRRPCFNDLKNHAWFQKNLNF